jgi:hypothetical protein
MAAFCSPGSCWSLPAVASGLLPPAACTAAAAAVAPAAARGLMGTGAMPDCCRRIGTSLPNTSHSSRGLGGALGLGGGSACCCGGGSGLPLPCCLARCCLAPSELARAAVRCSAALPVGPAAGCWAAASGPRLAAGACSCCCLGRCCCCCWPLDASSSNLSLSLPSAAQHQDQRQGVQQAGQVRPVPEAWLMPR